MLFDLVFAGQAALAFGLIVAHKSPRKTPLLLPCAKSDAVVCHFIILQKRSIVEVQNSAGNPPVFTAVQHPRMRLADQVYEQLIDAIQQGDIGAEDRLVQEKLAESFQISRTPVREALLRLEQEGVIEVSRHGRGFKLRTFDTREVDEIYVARAAIEAESARALAKTHTVEQLAQLRDLIRKKEVITEKSVKSYYEANHAIHKAIHDAAGNRYLIEMSEGLWNRAFSRRLFGTMGWTELEQSVGGHMPLIDAIETGDGDLAAKTMYDHVIAGLRLQKASS